MSARMELSNILFLGNTSFRGLLQREHQFALEFARRGYSVTFIEGMPSLFLKIQQFIRPDAGRGEAASVQYGGSLRILVPPVVPTFFRSSYAPMVDRAIFRQWIKKVSKAIEWEKTILIVTFPYWWYGFADRTLLPARVVVYDRCDALEVPSRTPTALRRMERAEMRILDECDVVTFSARTMERELKRRNNRPAFLFLPNAAPVNNRALTATSAGTERSIIGYAGALDVRRCDPELLGALAAAYSECEIRIVGTMDRVMRRHLTRHANINLVGPLGRDALNNEIARFSVGIIPYKQNSITAVVNPLKLYDYCAAGIPVVAMKTAELAHYGDIVYLSESADEFLNNVSRALSENNEQLKAERRSFAAANTWEHRAAQLIEFIENRWKS